MQALATALTRLGLITGLIGDTEAKSTLWAITVGPVSMIDAQDLEACYVLEYVTLLAETYSKILINLIILI